MRKREAIDTVTKSVPAFRTNRCRAAFDFLDHAFITPHVGGAIRDYEGGIGYMVREESQVLSGRRPPAQSGELGSRIDVPLPVRIPDVQRDRPKQRGEPGGFDASPTFLDIENPLNTLAIYYRDE